VMVTDFSGVALEFMILDRPVVYIDCPQFFESTLKTYGCDPVLGKSGDRFNAGRNYGVVVDSLSDMVKAVKRSLDNPDELSAKRKELTRLLLYNPGCSASIAADTVCRLLAEVSHGTESREVPPNSISPLLADPRE
jgi:CDP-glycerol glycerophosphotransferase (TagB/SpsB family)